MRGLARQPAPHGGTRARIPGEDLSVAVAAAFAILGEPDVGVLAAALDEPPAFLHEQERSLIAGAVESRRREFATGRRLAHALLSALGAPPGPLLPGIRRAPRWPEGFTGSISHSRELAIAAVARCGRLGGVGVDLEPDRALTPELVRAVLTTRERERMAALPGGTPAWSRLGFSAKESAYKAWSAELSCAAEFEDVELEFDVQRARFCARLRACRASGGVARELQGAFGRAAGHVWTVALVPGAE